MEPIKLFMLRLGCKPAGRHTEQHDVYFNVATDLKNMVPAIINFWPEARAAIHLDAWREVTFVGRYRIEMMPKEIVPPVGKEALVKLFFINLGGYKKDEFEEFHYKMLVAAKHKGEAVLEAKKIIF